MKAAILYGAKDIRVENRRTPAVMPGMVLLRNRRVGVCGSDIHYFEYGRCGNFVPDRPFVLGHEICADVVEVGPGVDSPNVGQRVTVNPARSCGRCTHCKRGRQNLCQKTMMLGSASSRPPTDGAFAEFTLVYADQCRLLPANVEDGTAALIEPLAVALHAVGRAGSVSGKKVLVIGAGTIGILLAATVHSFGALHVAVSDLISRRRANALNFGADIALDPASEEFLKEAQGLTNTGFDLIFEASGSSLALRQAFSLIGLGGKIIQIGTLDDADVPIPANLLMNREINLMGSMRYGTDFDDAIALAEAERIDLRRFISHVIPMESASGALLLAGDRSNSLKVQLEIT
jgi:L-idonate 5-dehydrogenase